SFEQVVRPDRERRSRALQQGPTLARARHRPPADARSVERGVAVRPHARQRQPYRGRRGRSGGQPRRRWRRLVRRVVERRLTAATFLRYAALQFLVLVPSAMALYAGGTWFDPLTTRYQFTHNFLSDLGMTHSFSGQSNYVSSAMFAIALATLGAA